MGSEASCRRPVVAAWALALLVALPVGLRAGAALAADEPVARPDCDRGVCGFNVVDSALLAEPCADVSVQVAYREAGGLAVIRCGDGPGREPLAYVFDRRAPGGPVFEIEGARFVKGAFLAEAAASGVPDRFSTVPLCEPPSASATAGASSGSVWLLLKAPAAGRPGGACYRLLRAVAARRGVSVLADDGSEAPSAAAVDTHQRWQSLVSRLVPLMQR